MRKASIRKAFPLGLGSALVAVGLVALACETETPTQSSDARQFDDAEVARASHEVESAGDTLASGARDPGERIESHQSRLRSDTEPTMTTDESPLYVVDGVIRNPMSLREFDCLDIESMEVLTGAAATDLYGSRGVNGAVLMTTTKR